VDVIFAIGPLQALAAAKATSTIPIVFVGGGDPVGIGLVKSVSRPGGNVTGLTLVAVELAAKRIQLLKEVVPVASRIAVLWNPNNLINRLELDEASRAGGMLGLTLLPVEIRTLEDIEGAFGAMTRAHAEALFILSSPLTFPNRTRLAKLASASGLPALVPLREYVETGFLVSYGPSYTDHCRQAAVYVDQILKGAKPADLPVQLPTRLELVINLKVANALRREIPPALLARADEVIE
jgi:putative ABC transport system substrate-binding protein